MSSPKVVKVEGTLRKAKVPNNPLKFIDSELYLREIDGTENSIRALPLSYVGGRVLTAHGPVYFRLNRQDGGGFLLSLSAPETDPLCIHNQWIGFRGSYDFNSACTAGRFHSLHAEPSPVKKDMPDHNTGYDLHDVLVCVIDLLRSASWWPLVVATANVHYQAYCQHFDQEIDPSVFQIPSSITALSRPDQVRLLTHSSKPIREAAIVLVMASRTPSNAPPSLN